MCSISVEHWIDLRHTYSFRIALTTARVYGAVVTGVAIVVKNRLAVAGNMRTRNERFDGFPNDQGNERLVCRVGLSRIVWLS